MGVLSEHEMRVLAFERSWSASDKPGMIDEDGKLRDLSKIVDNLGPNEISLERPYIKEHIESTRSAFGLAGATREVDFPAKLEAPIDPARHQDGRDTLEYCVAVSIAAAVVEELEVVNVKDGEPEMRIVVLR